MKKVLVVAQFTQLPGEAGNNRSRFRYISEYLSSAGYEVTQVTSTFRDVDKSQRDIKNRNFESVPYEIVTLDDPGYTKNVSFKRILSQNIFAKELKEWLKKQSDFDLIYCAIPPHEAGIVAANYAEKKKIPFVIDVQDLWPEAMKMAINIPLVSDLIFYPLKKMANKVYSRADGIVACSQTYLNKAVSVNKNATQKVAVFLGTDLSLFDKTSEVYMSKIIKEVNEKWITYTGSLSHSYDIKTLIESVNYLIKTKKNSEIKLIIMGNGPLEQEFRNLAMKLKIDVLFTGWISYGEMGAYLRKSDVLVNAIKRVAPGSITNKIGDYISAGVPIVNGSLNLEFMNMVEKHEIGYNYSPENVEEMSNAIEKVLKLTEKEKREIYLKARKLAEEKFDRKSTYPEIVQSVNRLLDLE